MPQMQSSGMTYADLQELPYHRHLHYELFDGELVTHDTRAQQRPVSTLWSFLLDLGLKDRAPMLSVRNEWYVDDVNVFRPDVLYRADFVAEHVQHPRRAERLRSAAPFPPALVVDMLEPPERTAERRRLEGYARGGLRHYWVADGTVPSYTLFERVSGELVQTAMVRGDDTLAVDEPFPITLCPRGQVV